MRFTERQPPTSWNKANPQEYGFYSNVNPDVDHPRWSQGRERRIGEFAKRRTLMFNGYGSAVAPLSAGMDLKRFFRNEKAGLAEAAAVRRASRAPDCARTAERRV